MAIVESFVFNMFYENTYVVYDETKECVIIDPGCYTPQERTKLQIFIESNDLKPVMLINTHCHVDHVFGNHFVANSWNLDLYIPDGEQIVLESFPRVGFFFLTV